MSPRLDSTRAEGVDTGWPSGRETGSLIWIFIRFATFMVREGSWLFEFIIINRLCSVIGAASSSAAAAAAVVAVWCKGGVSQFWLWEVGSFYWPIHLNLNERTEERTTTTTSRLPGEIRNLDLETGNWGQAQNAACVSDPSLPHNSADVKQLLFCRAPCLLIN